MGFIKNKSQDYLLSKLMDEVSALSAHIKNLFEEQVIKANTNKQIVRGLKEEGRHFNLEPFTEKIAKLIDSQESKIQEACDSMKKIEHHLDLLIHMEQASLVIHSKENQDDLSDMIDVHNMPLEKFKNEKEQVKMLISSFDILKVELEKQKEYIKNFDFKDSTLDERYFYESEKLESKLSEDEIVSVSHLKEFCSDLKQMIDSRIKSKKMFSSETDREAMHMINELKRIKMKQGFFGISFYKFTVKMINKNVRSSHVRKLIVFILFFLFSRLKRYKPDVFNSQMRVAMLLYNLLDKLKINREQMDHITGAALIAMLDALDMKDESDELHVIRNYYLTVNQLFNEEFTFVSSVLAEFKTGEGESLPWIKEGAKLIELVYDFDLELQNFKLEAGEFMANRQTIEKELLEAHPGFTAEVKFLFDSWQSLIPKELLLN